MKNLKLVYYVSDTDADFVQIFDMKMPTLKKQQTSMSGIFLAKKKLWNI